MPQSNLNRSRFIMGLILILIAVLMFVFLRDTYSTAGAIAIGVLGLVSVAISRKK
jgi:hypothetical protein